MRPTSHTALPTIAVEPRTALIIDACRRIEQAESPPSLATLAAEAGLSRFHFQRLFKAVTGLSPKAYADAARERRLREQLASGERITDAIYNAGYNAPSRFYERSAEVLGMSPSEWRDGGAQHTIRFAIGASSLGAILVAASAAGICSILLGDEPEALLRDLQDRFPKADLIGADAGFETWVAGVVGLVEAPGLGLNLPLDVRGTAFQRRVWQALREIPAGSTCTYSEIARRIDAPKAARAVAQACAANPLAIAIPCHRVVRNDGALSGYRWGIERKRALLARERSRDGD